MLYLFIFIIGLVIGSFLNRCIYRLPAGESEVSRHSGADATAFSARHTLVALVTGGLFLWCFAVFGLGPVLVQALVLVSFLVVITFIDYDHQLILDKVLIWLAAAGAAINIALNSYTLWAPRIGAPAPYAAPYLAPENMLAGSLLGGGILLVVAVLTRGGMGGGDIKFTAALGLWFGWQHTLLLVFLSFIIGGVGSFTLMALRRKGRKDFIPFGPFIAVGALVTLLFGHRILLWYGQPWLIR